MKTFKTYVKEGMDRGKYGAGNVGVQTADGVCASLNVIPCAASPSRFGVGIFDALFITRTSP